MPVLQKRDVLAILKVPVAHGNNSILHLLKLQNCRATKLRCMGGHGEVALQCRCWGRLCVPGKSSPAVNPLLVQLVCTGVGKSAPISEAHVLCKKEIICYSPI